MTGLLEEQRKGKDVLHTNSNVENLGKEEEESPEASKVGDSPRYEEKSRSMVPLFSDWESDPPRASFLIQECLSRDHLSYPQRDSSSAVWAILLFRAAVIEGEVGNPLWPDWAYHHIDENNLNWTSN